MEKTLSRSYFTTIRGNKQLSPPMYQKRMGSIASLDVWERITPFRMQPEFSVRLLSMERREKGL